MAKNINDIMDDLTDETEGEDEVAVKDILDGFDGRAFGPILLVLGLFAITPLGAIPFVPTAIAVLLVLFVSQKLMGRKSPWVPKKLRKQSVSRDKMLSAFKKARKPAKIIDSFLKPRLTFIVTGPMSYVLAALAILLAFTMPPLEAVPFAVVVPGVGIVMLGLAQTARDGVLGILAMLITSGAIGLVVWWFVF